MKKAAAQQVIDENQNLINTRWKSKLDGSIIKITRLKIDKGDKYDNEIDDDYEPHAVFGILNAEDLSVTIPVLFATYSEITLE